jgi:hydroxypyruvate isomerase
MKVAANISFLFQELPFEQRFAAARESGFEGVEILFPYEHEPEGIRSLSLDAGVEVVLFNSPPGNLAAGEAGFAAIPGCEAEFEQSFRTAMRYAQVLKCPRIHVLAGNLPDEWRDHSRVVETFVRNLQWAADVASPHDITLLIEPLNRFDFPRYAHATLEQAAQIVERARRDNIGLQFDLYHCQIMGGDLTRRLQTYAHLIRHVQISCVPGRGEPDRGEVNLEFVLRTLAVAGYKGWISGEYKPIAGTRESLGWLRTVAAISSG